MLVVFCPACNARHRGENFCSVCGTALHQPHPSDPAPGVWSRDHLYGPPAQPSFGHKLPTGPKSTMWSTGRSRKVFLSIVIFPVLLVAGLALVGAMLPAELPPQLPSSAEPLAPPTSNAYSPGDVSETTSGAPSEPAWITAAVEEGVRGETLYAVELRAYTRHIATWWNEIMPSVHGVEFGELSGGLVAATPQTRLPGCMEGEDVTDNAFYAPCLDAIAYDEAVLFPRLHSGYGSIALGVILAHEWGHAVQGRTGDLGRLPSHTAEMQADCYAGAWLAAFKAHAGTQSLMSGGEDFNALAAIVSELSFWDIGLDSGGDPESHGSAFDRVSAFMDGRENSAPKCALYSTNPPAPVMPLWTSTEDYYNGGDLSGEALAAVLYDATAEYWPRLPQGTLMPATMGYEEGAKIGCKPRPGELSFGWCPAQRSIAAYDIGDVYGDFTIGASLGLAWADAYKQFSGVQTHRACLVGEWMRSLDGGAVKTVSLSPGDVDEAVGVMLIADSVPNSAGEYALRHVEEFKRGYLQGCL